MSRDGLVWVLGAVGAVAITGSLVAGAREVRAKTRGSTSRWDPRLPVGTRVRITSDLVDVDDDTGRKFVRARAGQTGTVVDLPRESNWPRVDLDGGGYVIVDMQAGEASVVEAGSAARVSRPSRPGRYAEMDPRSRVRLYRGQPKMIYPWRAPHGWAYTLAQPPFRPTGDVDTERSESMHGVRTRSIMAAHRGRDQSPNKQPGDKRNLPDTVYQTWVERRDGEYVASESRLASHLYTTPPTRAEFEEAWNKRRFPLRSPEVIAAWSLDWVPPVRPVSRPMKPK